MLSRYTDERCLTGHKKRPPGTLIGACLLPTSRIIRLNKNRSRYLPIRRLLLRTIKQPQHPQHCFPTIPPFLSQLRTQCFVLLAPPPTRVVAFLRRRSTLLLPVPHRPGREACIFLTKTPIPIAETLNGTLTVPLPKPNQGPRRPHQLRQVIKEVLGLGRLRPTTVIYHRF